jgi:hypothetical protein
VSTDTDTSEMARADLVKAIREYAEAHKSEPGWRGVLTYSDYELGYVMLAGYVTLTAALKALQPIVAAYAGYDAAEYGAAAVTEAP